MEKDVYQHRKVLTSAERENGERNFISIKFIY